MAYEYRSSGDYPSMILVGPANLRTVLSHPETIAALVKFKYSEASSNRINILTGLIKVLFQEVLFRQGTFTLPATQGDGTAISVKLNTGSKYVPTQLVGVIKPPNKLYPTPDKVYVGTTYGERNDQVGVLVDNSSIDLVL